MTAKFSGLNKQEEIISLLNDLGKLTLEPPIRYKLTPHTQVIKVHELDTDSVIAPELEDTVLQRLKWLKYLKEQINK